MSESYEIRDAVAEAISECMPALKAFRQSSGLASHDVAVAAGIDPNRLAILENGELTASDAEIDALAEVLAVPGDLSNDE